MKFLFLTAFSCLLSLYSTPSYSSPKFTFKMFIMHSTNAGVKIVTPQLPFDIDILKRRTNEDWFESVNELNDEDFKSYLEQKISRDSSVDLNDEWTKEALDNLLIKRRIVRATHLTEKELVNFSVNQIKHKTFEQKVNFFRSFFLDISYVYDYKRTKGKGDIEISLNTLFKSVRNLYETEGTKAGVCRDMHQGVLRIMNKSGIDSAFGSSYVTPSSSHINIILTDPNNKNTVIGFNYEYVDYRSGKAGQSLLTMNHANPSVGLGFYIWNEKDRVELYVPSDKSILLYRATGGDLNKFNPFILEENKIIRADAQTRLGQLALFYAIADSGDGTQVAGVSLDDDFEFDSKYFRGQHASALFLSNRDFGIEDEGSINTFGYYGRFFIEALKEFKVGPRSTIKFNLTTLLQFSTFYAKVKSETYQIDTGKLKADGSIALGAGVYLDQNFLKFDHKLYLNIEGLPQTGDITKFSLYHPFAGGFDVGFSRLMLGEEFKMKHGQYSTNLYWRLMYHRLGQFNLFLGQVGADFNATKIKTTFGVKAQDCISKNCPIWLIGSRGSMQFNILNNYFERVSFGANTMINEYDYNQYYFGLILKGNL